MKEKIDRFLACKKFAIAGVSRSKHKFGNAIYRTLKKKEFHIAPINPYLDEFEGDMCYRSVKDLPDDVEALIVVASPGSGLEIIREASQKGIKNIFLQQGAHNDEILNYAEENGINLIYKQCILMFANPTGLHKFHAGLARFFGFYPN